MVKLLEETEIDPIMEQVEEVMDATESAEMAKRFAYVPDGIRDLDLSDRTKIGEVTIRPGRDKNIQKGRPAARQAWSWNGTVTVLPLAWNPEGNRHDGARHYLLKRHCLCCNSSGFFGARCTDCVRHNCQKCKASTDRTTEHKFDNGKTIKGWVIPNFYLRQDDVPIQTQFYGSVDCVIPQCPRRGGVGFITDQAMRLHATNRHRIEYRIHLDSLAAAKSDQTDTLLQRIANLEGRLQERPQAQAPQPTKAVQAVPRAAKSGRKWTPERRKAASEAAKRRAAVGVA